MARYRLHVSIAILSAAILASQLAFMQILSNMQWYHFAYMVISVALLGFGAAGTVLAVFRRTLLEHKEIILPLLMMLCGISYAIVIDIAQYGTVRFDAYLLFTDYTQIGRLYLTYLVFFIPFFIGALAIGLLFTSHVENISTIYFANLIGSAAGSLVILVLIPLFSPGQLPSVIGILPLLAGLIILPNRKKVLYILVALLGTMVCMIKISDPTPLQLSQYKDLSKTLLLPDSKINIQKNSPYGFVQTVTSPVLKYAPGLSLTAPKAGKVEEAVFVNGDWFSGVMKRELQDTSILDYTTSALPYIMLPRSNVLVLHAGTGMNAHHAIHHDAAHVTMIEPNAVVAYLLKNELAKESDSLLYDPRVKLHVTEPRTFLQMDTNKYDLIVLPMVGTFGGSGGMYALQERFILTKESFHDMWDKLTDNGSITVTSWMDFPPRNTIKVLATMVEVLQEQNLKDPTSHLIAIRSWGTITLVMTRSAVSESGIMRIRDFCTRMGFDPVLLPGLQAGEREQNNFMEDQGFFSAVDQVMSSDRSSFYSRYNFKVQPATDNQPYFSQFIKWSSLRRMADYFGTPTLPFFEIGYLLVIVTLIQIALISVVLILLPLFRLGWKGSKKWMTIFYFGGIGLGYMFVEIIFIQRFILYFGNPVYSAAAVVATLLFFSGIGSYSVNYVQQARKKMSLVFILIIIILLIYTWLLTPVLQGSIHLGFPLKVLVVFILLAPAAFLMGMPFPAGLSYISRNNAVAVPWAWGLNGCASVISTALATVIAVEMGFTWVMLLAAMAYVLPLSVTHKM